MAKTEVPPKKKNEQVPPTAIGWMVRVSTLLFLGLLVFVLARETLSQSRPPKVVAVADWMGSRSAGSGFVIPVKISNEGTLPTSNIVLSIHRNETDPAEITIPLLGARDEVTVEVFFPVRPVHIEYEVQSQQTM